MYSSTKLKLSGNAILPAYGPAEGAREYFFIKLGGTVAKRPSTQRLIVTKDGESLIATTSLSQEMQRAIRGAETGGAMERLLEALTKIPGQGRRLKVAGV